MKNLLLILIAAGLSGYFMDLSSEDLLTNRVMPALFGLSILSLLIWISNRVDSDRIPLVPGNNGHHGGSDSGGGDGGA